MLYVLADEWVRQRQTLAALGGLLRNPDAPGDEQPVDPDLLETRLAEAEAATVDAPGRATDPAQRAAQIAAFMSGG